MQKQHDAVSSLLTETWDLLLGRVDSLPVGWAEARGWSSYLLGLSDEALAKADTLGVAEWFVADPRCPASLRDLAAQVQALIVLPRWEFPEMQKANLRGVSDRKQQQIATVLHALTNWYPQLAHVVDVGAGRGHLTTQTAQALAVPALGLEWDPERVRVARLVAADAPVEFLSTDVLSPDFAPLNHLSPMKDRLLMALHGCGALGDALLRAAVSLRAHVMLLACCPQKIRGKVRTPLGGRGLEIPKEILGLANVLPRTMGVEGSLTEELATKETRLALRYLLETRGLSPSPGEEMRGVNRRLVHAGFQVLAESVFRQHGFPGPTSAELQLAANHAHNEYLAHRRLSLPRSMLGRLLEIYLALDRALFLQTAGYGVQIMELFPVGVSPRNIAILARWDA